MNQNLLDYIRTLSDDDTKTLSQKALKTAEEVGELAKKVLPYDGAFATNHRLVGREDIIEEVADVILCALSIAYNLEATDLEVTNMMERKAQKWAELQRRETKGKFPLPFEIHVTVKLDEVDGPGAIQKFRDTCAEVSVKPIILDLQDKQGSSVMSDVMTSSKHFGTNSSALKYVYGVAGQLTGAGFNVVRSKIETVPWHPAAPQQKGDQMPKDCYFESHIPVRIQPEKVGNVSYLLATNGFADVHVSRNTFKQLEDGYGIVMLTYRQYDGYADQFESKVKEIVAVLGDYVSGKVHTEFALYDTKVHHDALWLK